MLSKFQVLIGGWVGWVSTGIIWLALFLHLYLTATCGAVKRQDNLNNLIGGLYNEKSLFHGEAKSLKAAVVPDATLPREFLFIIIHWPFMLFLRLCLDISCTTIALIQNVTFSWMKPLHVSGNSIQQHHFYNFGTSQVTAHLKCNPMHIAQKANSLYWLGLSSR